ncbi:hypothetical protein G9A89_014345 [Geosiphon pyriformis]|nr:hypothetical protein G9A89_014345 [Geosiphon pyriformis]
MITFPFSKFSKSPTQSKANSPRESPVITFAAHFPDINAIYGVQFEHYLPLTSNYIIFSPNRSLSDLIFSINFYPQNSSEWVNFDETLRKFSGLPPKDAVNNTTVFINVEDFLQERNNTSSIMHILVSNVPRGKIEVPEKVIAVLVAFIVMILLGVFVSFVFVMLKKWLDRSN